MERVGTSLAWTVCDFRKVQFCPWFQWCEEQVFNLDLSVSEFLGNSFKAMPTPAAFQPESERGGVAAAAEVALRFASAAEGVRSWAEPRQTLGSFWRCLFFRGPRDTGKEWTAGCGLSCECCPAERRQLCGRDLGGLLTPVPCAWDQCELRHCPAKEQHVALGWLHKIHPTL